MGSRVSSSTLSFCFPLQGNSDHEVQHHGQSNEASAYPETSCDAENFGRNFSQDHTNRDAANEDYQARAGGTNGHYPLNVGRGPFAYHDAVSRNVCSRLEMAGGGIWREYITFASRAEGIIGLHFCEWCGTRLRS